MTAARESLAFIGGTPSSDSIRANHVDRRIEGVIDEGSRRAIGLRCRQRRVLADDECDAAVRVDMVGTILCIILKNEESGIVPNTGCARPRQTTRPTARSLSATEAAGPGQTFLATRRVVIG